MLVVTQRRPSAEVVEVAVVESDMGDDDAEDMALVDLI